MMQEIRKVRRDKEAYMQDVPEAVHHDNTSPESFKSVVKISECCRTLVRRASNERIAANREQLWTAASTTSKGEQ